MQAISSDDLLFAYTSHSSQLLTVHSVTNLASLPQAKPKHQ